MKNLIAKCNDLSSSTRILAIPKGNVTREYHENEDHELVVMDTWYVSDGQDDVIPEFEVVAFFPKEEWQDLRDSIYSAKQAKKDLEEAAKWLRSRKEVIALEIKNLKIGNE